MKLSVQTNKLFMVLMLTALIILVFILSGFSVLAAPNLGSESPEQVSVIKNGDFEEWDTTNPLHGIALNWLGYSNGQAVFGFYDETWAEAVQTGKHAQLMEINTVEANILDRVIAVYQTVDVTPNSQYNLFIRAIMRSQAPAISRNQHEVEMHWGIDFAGEGKYENVTEWHLMPLEEQYRLGSSGQYPEDIPLHYEVVTGTVATANSSKVTLFIRGLKKFPTGTEVNFDVDNVSLVGPKPDAAQPAPAATTTIVTTPVASIPSTGAILPGNLSVGTVLLAGLVVIVLTAGAASALLFKH